MSAVSYEDWRAPYDDLFVTASRVKQLSEYVAFGIKPESDLIVAVLEGDLFAAIDLDEPIPLNVAALAAWLYDNGPNACYGSKDKVAAWLKVNAKEKLNVW